MNEFCETKFFFWLLWLLLLIRNWTFNFTFDGWSFLFCFSALLVTVNLYSEFAQRLLNWLSRRCDVNSCTAHNQSQHSIELQYIVKSASEPGLVLYVQFMFQRKQQAGERVRAIRIICNFRITIAQKKLFFHPLFRIKFSISFIVGTLCCEIIFHDNF